MWSRPRRQGQPSLLDLPPVKRAEGEPEIEVERESQKEHQARRGKNDEDRRQEEGEAVLRKEPTKPTWAGLNAYAEHEEMRPIFRKASSTRMPKWPKMRATENDGGDIQGKALDLHLAEEEPQGHDEEKSAKVTGLENFHAAFILTSRQRPCKGTLFPEGRKGYAGFFKLIADRLDPLLKRPGYRHGRRRSGRLGEFRRRRR